MADGEYRDAESLGISTSVLGEFMSKLFQALCTAAIAATVLVLATAPAHAASTTFTCTVSGVQVVATGSQRVAVNCTTSTSGGISWFAFRFSDDPEMAKMLLSIFTTARVSGRPVVIVFESTDTSGAAWGCQSNDCRIVQLAVLR